MIKQLIKSSPGFQYSINLRFDTRDAQKMSAYIPTEKAVLFLKDFMESLNDESTQRSRIMIGPYGTGKSHFAAMIVALLEGYLPEDTFDSIFEKISAYSEPELAKQMRQTVRANKRYLPVLISGNGNELEQSFTYGLKQALEQNGLSEVVPQTIYKEIDNRIALWKTDFPDTYRLFCDLLHEDYDLSIEVFQSKSEEHEEDVFEVFKKLFPLVSSGAQFSPLSTQDMAGLYKDIVPQIQKFGYHGVLIVYDEFNNFLENAVKKSTPINLKPLQDLAEMCNRSFELPVHLLLVSHQHISQYAAKLSDELVNEWRKVEGRFKAFELTQKSSQTYNLISRVIIKEPTWWPGFVKKHESQFADLGFMANAHKMFQELDKEQMHEWVIKGCYPLHPCTTFCLPRLSNLIAQNERTIFTFLATNDFNTLGRFVEDFNPKQFYLLTADVLFDYFEDLMRKQNKGERIYQVWTQTRRAIERAKDLQAITKKIIKALGVFKAVGEEKSLPSTPDMLKYALNASDKDFEESLSELTKEKLIYIRRSDQIIDFLDKSDVDFKDEVNRIKGTYNYAQEFDLDLVLNRDFKPYPVIANRYNDKFEMNRYFIPQFYSAARLKKGIDWDSELIGNGYVDGILALMVAETVGEVNEIKDYISKIKNEQILFVMNNEPLKISAILSDYKALSILREDHKFLEDHPLCLIELEAYLDDYRDEIDSELEKILDPRGGQAIYIAGGKQISTINSAARLSRTVSDICERVFCKSPLINNELINKNKITKVISNAQIKVNKGILTGEKKPNLGLTGTGPDVSIFRSLVKRTGIYQINENEGHLDFNTIIDKNLKEALNMVDKWILPGTSNYVSVEEIYQTLRKPPFGMRLGVLPVLLTLGLSKYKNYIIVKNHLGVEEPFTAELIEQIHFHPNHFLLHIEGWNNDKEFFLNKLSELFKEYREQEVESSNRLYPVARSVINWFTFLPKFTRESNQFQGVTASLRRMLHKPNLDSSDFLFKRLPMALMDDNDFITNHCHTYIKLLTEAKAELEAHLEIKKDEINKKLIELFKDDKNCVEALSALSIIRNWYEKLRQPSKDHLFEGNICNFIEVVKNHRGYDNEKFILMLSRKVTGLRIEDWSDEFFVGFMFELEEIRRAIDEFDQQTVTNGRQNYDLTKIVTITSLGQAKERTFKKTDIGEMGDILLNMLKSSIESFGDSISQNEKRQILLSLLEKIENPASGEF